MTAMNGKERISRILQRKSVDRIGVFEHFWSDTQEEWTRQGHMKKDENLLDTFGLDIQNSWPLKMMVHHDREPVVIAEDEDTITMLDGNGATMRRHKHHAGVPEHIGFAVQNNADWQEKAHDLLTPSRERINFEAYRNAKREAAAAGRFFNCSGTNVFEQMHPLCGHEFLLMGMALEPEWVAEMVDVYSNMTVNMLEMLFAEEGLPDGIWFYEDMGFKDHPFISLDMYRELILPGHKKTIDFAHSLGLPVTMHSCGFVEPLLPGMIEAGIDCLQVIEVKAGMDLLRLHRNYGDRLSFCGGMDARNLVANDRTAIKAELEKKIPVVKNGFGYILHSDHSIPNSCEFETCKYFIEEGLKLGKY